MTEKKTSAKAADLAAQTEFSDKVDKNEDVKLTKEEKLAIEVQSQVTEGGDSFGKFKLKDPKTSYQEPGFTLALDQAKELPENPSPDLLARIRSGFIVKA